MTKLLIKLFIKDSENVTDKKVRAKYGFLSGIVGIVLNVLLFAFKLFLGIISGSVAIKNSAFDHLSDSASSLVTLWGAKLSAKPRDREHPFGHGRVEYIASFIISSLIIVVGFELLRSSIEKIINPTPVVFSIPVLISLFVALLIKFWMAFFYKTLGKKINSAPLIAASQDSRNDSVSTFLNIASLCISPLVSFPLDGILGCVVALYVIKNGIDLIRDTSDEILGKSADAETVKAIEKEILSHKCILGVHDLIVHNYGPGNLFATCHTEVDKRDDIEEVHDTIDIIEHDVFNKLGIILTIHMDPIETDNPLLDEYKSFILSVLQNENKDFSIHDFRMTKGPTHTNLVFDVLVPYTYKNDDSAIKTLLYKALNEKYKDTTFYLVLTFDRSF